MDLSYVGSEGDQAAEQGKKPKSKAKAKAKAAGTTPNKGKSCASAILDGRPVVESDVNSAVQMWLKELGADVAKCIQITRALRTNGVPRREPSCCKK